MIRRWEIKSDSLGRPHGLIPSNTGRWIRYSDAETLSAEIEQLTDDASSWHTKYLRESLESERLTAENRSLAEGLRKALIGQGCKPYEADEFVAMHGNSASTRQRLDLDCDHRWVTDNFGPTRCEKCGGTNL